MAVAVAVGVAAAAIAAGDADDATAALIANTAAFVVRHGGDVAESKLKARTAPDGKLAFIFPHHTRHTQYQQNIKRIREQDQTQNQSSQPQPPPVPPPEHSSSRAPLLDRLRTHISSSRNGATPVPPLLLVPITIPAVASSLTAVAAAFIAVNGKAHSAALASSRYADALIAASDAQNPHGATHRSAIRQIVQAATDSTNRHAPPPTPQTHFDNVFSRVRRMSAARTRDGGGGGGDGDSNVATLSARRIVSDVDWSHFVVLHRVDFVAAERMYLPANAANEYEMRAIAKQIVAPQHADTTAATSAPSSSSIYERCVSCHELILVSEMSEHLRIEGLLSTARTLKPPSARSHIVTDTQLAENIVALFPSKRRYDDADKQSADVPPNKIIKTSETGKTTAAASNVSPSPMSLPTSASDVPVPFTLSIALSGVLVSNAPSRIELAGVVRTDTVDSIKARIAQRIGVAANKLKLSLPNTVSASASAVFLNRERSTLAEYDIAADAVVTAAIKERGRSTRK